MSHLRYRFMLNGRTPNYVADKTVHGMLHRKEHIFMSNFDRILIFLVSVVPSECTNLFMDFAGFKSIHSQLMR
ncbi:unnamed protein product [Allacma fusca]|uniref:Uncharacterized protein n=1 Tax=Allacma fusca TaxID=39272 RepID=A0A8J2JP47_9HEXA|nr:unnamed protein product [Allacma fusca]